MTLRSNMCERTYNALQCKISDFDMGAKQSRLSEEDFLFLEEETAMSKATLEVTIGQSLQ